MSDTQPVDPHAPGEDFSTLGDHLRSWAREHGDRTAVVENSLESEAESSRRWSYRQLDQWVDRLSAGFWRLGIRCGDRVLMQLPNRGSFLASCFALFRIGAIPILAMPAHRQHDLEALCALAEPVACVIPDRFLGFDHLAMMEQVAERQPCLQHIIVDGQAGGRIALSELEDETPPPAEVNVGDIALLLLSGGTTGTPKLIPRTHRDYAFNARASASVCGFDANTVYLAALPVAHNFPLACPGVLGTLAVGGTVVLAATPGFDECFPLIERERVTTTALVPALVSLWLEAREWDPSDLSSLTLLQVGGALLDTSLAQRIRPVLGCDLQQVFGMAEGLLCFTRLDDPEEVVFHTQGRPLSPQDEVCIVDEQGRDVAEGDVGELLTRGPYTIHGYYRAERHNRRAFTEDGFYRSGDLVKRVAGGNLVVVGRVKEQINRGGEKIAAVEIEAHLNAHPGVTDVVVVGVSDERLGERICACVISDESELGLGQLQQFLAQRGVARHKWPDQLLCRAAWPLTAVGKIDRKALASQATSASAQRGQEQHSYQEQSRYQEREIVLASDPSVLVGALLRAGLDEEVTLYERNSEWSLGLGVNAIIEFDGEQVTLTQAQGAVQRWREPVFADAMRTALDALPLRGRRAYGQADFELARVLHGLSHEQGKPLLRLVIPRQEVRIEGQRAVVRGEHDVDLLAANIRALDQEHRGALLGRPLSVPVRGDGEHYRRAVSRALEDIHSGMYQKVIVSRQVAIPERLDMVSSYLAGRRVNTPARSFFTSRPGFAAAGFSPETVVEVGADGRISTQPLAGTRACGETPDQRAVLRSELLGDTKEIAEHAVSVKLALEELKQVCDHDHIALGDFMDICERGPVQHLGSRLSGRLRAGQHCWHAFAALFPAVTASGIPKRESIEAIARLEQCPRGLYSGAVMVLDDEGMLDAALVLRAFYRQGERQWLQAGAGVVALSTPERELEETCEKLTSASMALMAEAADEATTPCLELSREDQA